MYQPRHVDSHRGHRWRCTMSRSEPDVLGNSLQSQMASETFSGSRGLPTKIILIVGKVGFRKAKFKQPA